MPDWGESSGGSGFVAVAGIGLAADFGGVGGVEAAVRVWSLDFRSSSSRRCLRNPTQAKRRLEWGTLGNLASQEQSRSLHFAVASLRKASAPVGMTSSPKSTQNRTAYPLRQAQGRLSRWSA